MTRRLAPALVSFALLLAACGVDTTGLSAESSRTDQGSSSAAVTVTEFADLQCPACAAAHNLLTKPVLEKYAGRIRFRFMHFPLRSIHPYALEAAEAAECAADQGKFWEFVDINYQNQQSLKSAALREWAEELGLDTALFDRCVRSGIKEDTILADYAEGEKAGVQGTPTYFVNGQKVGSNTIQGLSDAIDAALAQGSMMRL